MNRRSTLIGLATAIFIPFLIAAFASFFLHHRGWTPRSSAHGHVYSPAIVLLPIVNSERSEYWTLLVITQDPFSEEIKKWSSLPEFFPSSPLKIRALNPDSINTDTFQSLQNPLSFDLKTPGTLLLLDSRGFIAMSFSCDIVVQDVFKDLKKILPKHPPRKARS